MKNKVNLIGQLTNDPVVKTFDSGAKVCNFSIVTKDFVTDEKNEKKMVTAFHFIRCWNRFAENTEKYLKKGSLVDIEGKLSYDAWEGPNGCKHSKAVITINEIIFLDKKQNKQGQ